MFLLFIGILKPGSIKIERGMKKYFRGLILRLFGLMGSSLVPSEGPRARGYVGEIYQILEILCFT